MICCSDTEITHADSKKRGSSN